MANGTCPGCQELLYRMAEVERRVQVKAPQLEICVVDGDAVGGLEQEGIHQASKFSPDRLLSASAVLREKGYNCLIIFTSHDMEPHWRAWQGDSIDETKVMWKVRSYDVHDLVQCASDYCCRLVSNCNVQSLEDSWKLPACARDWLERHQSEITGFRWKNQNQFTVPHVNQVEEQSLHKPGPEPYSLSGQTSHGVYCGHASEATSHVTETTTRLESALVSPPQSPKGPPPGALMTAPGVLASQHPTQGSPVSVSSSSCVSAPTSTVIVSSAAAAPQRPPGPPPGASAPPAPPANLEVSTPASTSTPLIDETDFCIKMVQHGGKQLVCFLLKAVGCALAQWACTMADNVVNGEVAENENCEEVPSLLELSPWTSTVISTLLEDPMWASTKCTIIEVTSGMWNGLRAIGVGSNMKARKRASRLAICIAVLAGGDSQETEDKMRVNLSEDPIMLHQMRSAVTQVKECLARGLPTDGPIGAPPGISLSPRVGPPGLLPKAGGQLPRPPPPPTSFAHSVAPPAPAGQPPLSALFGPPGPPPELTDEASSSNVRRSPPPAPRGPPPAQGLAPAPPPPPQRIPVDSKGNQAAAGPLPEPRIVSVGGSMTIQSRRVPPAQPPKSTGVALLGAEDKPDDVHTLDVAEVDDASLHEHCAIRESVQLQQVPLGERPENEGPTMVNASSDLPQRVSMQSIELGSSSAPQGSGQYSAWPPWDPLKNLRDDRQLRGRSKDNRGRSKH